MPLPGVETLLRSYHYPYSEPLSIVIHEEYCTPGYSGEIYQESLSRPPMPIKDYAKPLEIAEPEFSGRNCYSCPPVMSYREIHPCPPSPPTTAPPSFSCIVEAGEDIEEDQDEDEAPEDEEVKIINEKAAQQNQQPGFFLPSTTTAINLPYPPYVYHFQLPVNQNFVPNFYGLPEQIPHYPLYL